MPSSSPLDKWSTIIVPNASHITLIVVRKRSLWEVFMGGWDYLENWIKFKNTHRSQSTAIMMVTSSAIKRSFLKRVYLSACLSLPGRPTVSSTITMVINPAWGIPAAPIEAAVAVTLTATMWPRVKFMFLNWAMKSAATASYKAVPGKRGNNWQNSGATKNLQLTVHVYLKVIRR